ncbi:MAG: hypothetical protein F4Y27_10700, partial [Acidimicrobiaceae bacterium]|nr:hypothetical protein [Acidimicrobiaceae bacterium]
YGGVTGESVSVVVSDDDTAGVRLGIVSSLTVPEDGSRRGSWSVVLGSEPTADVEVSVVSGDSSVLLVDGAGSVVLTFTPGSWDTAQTVTVVGVDDDVDNSGDSRSVSVSHSVSSVDVDYDGFLVSSVTVMVSDDDTAGVVVSDGVLFLGERDSGVYSVVLASDPVDDVVVSVFSGDPSAVTVDTDRTERGLQRRLTFNGGVSGVAGAWDVKQNVLVVAVGDDDVDSEQGVRVMHTVNRRGPYGGVVVDDVLVYVADDDARANKGLTARFGGFVGDGDGVLVEDESTRLRYRLSDELAEGETVSLLLRLSGGVVGEDYSLSLAGSGEGVSLSVPEASGGSVVASVVLTFTGGAQEALLKVSTIAGGGAGDGAEDCVPTEVVTCEPGLGDWFLAVGLVAAYSPDGSVQERDGVGGVRLKDGPQTTRLHVLPRDRVVVEGFTPNNFVSGIWKVPSSEGAVAYEVSLGSDPGGTVTVTPVSSDSSVAAVSPALTFDSDDWDTAQTVTVTVADVGAVTVSHAVEGYGTVTAGPDVGLLVVVFPVAQFAQNSYSAGEAPRRRSVDVGVSLSAPAPAGGLTVAYTVAGTAASGVDYTELSGSVAVAAGETAATVSVAVVDDRVDEDDETIVLTLADGAGYTVGTDKATTVTVTDDDRAGVRLSVGSASSVPEDGSSTGSYLIKLASQPTHDVTLTVTAGVGVLVDGPDASKEFTSTEFLTFTSLNWDTAQTVNVQGQDDNVDNIGGKRTVSIQHSVSSDDTKYAVVLVSALGVDVTDDDAAPTGIVLSVSPTKITESAVGAGRDVTVTATVQGPTTFGVAKTVGVTAARTSGQVGVNNISGFDVVIAAGETSGSATVTVVPQPDDVDEVDAVVAFTGAVDGDSSVSVTGASLTVTDDDRAGVRLSVGSAS